jgi:hypothetical protein
MVEHAAAMGATVYPGVEVPLAVTEENADVVMTELRARLATYGEAIEARGCASIAGAYRTRVTPGCAALGFIDDVTRIEQDGFLLRVAHDVYVQYEEDWRHKGVVVGAALDVQHAMDPGIDLEGWVEDGLVVLRHEPTDCRIVLVPMER